MRRFRSKPSLGAEDKSKSKNSGSGSSLVRKMSLRKSMSRLFNRKKAIAEQPVITVTEEKTEEGNEYQHLTIEKFMAGNPDEVYDEFLNYLWKENAGLSVFSTSYVEKEQKNGDVEGQTFNTLGVSQEVTSSRPGDFIEYEITNGPFPVSFLKGRINFLERQEETTKVEWIVDFKPMDMGLLSTALGQERAENVAVSIAELMITNIFPYLLGRLQDKLNAKHGIDGADADDDIHAITSSNNVNESKEEDSDDEDDDAEELEIDLKNLQPAARMQSGYTGHLTSQQKQALIEFKELCKKSKYSKDMLDHPDGDNWLLRFLRAECKGRKRKFQVQKSFARFEKTMAWRVENKVMDYVDKKAKGFDEFLEVCGELVIVDKEGRPTIFTRAGPLSTSLNTKLYSPEVWEKMIACLSETRLDICRESTKRLGHEVSATVVVYDLKGCGMASRKILPFVKIVNRIASTHYPEFVDQIILCNAPSVFSFLWGLASPILDPVTREKVKIFSYSKKETEKLQQQLIKNIGAENLPKEFGGQSDIEIPEPNPGKKKSDYY